MGDYERKTFLLDEITFFEWYDGIVRAIGVYGKRYYLVTLVAFDPATNRRTYVMLDLEPTAAIQMKRLSNWKDEPHLEGAWEQLNELHRNAVTGYDGSIYCFAGEPEKGKEISAVTVGAECLKELINYDFEQTMEPATKEFWFKTR